MDAISNPNCLILAIIPAVCDLANSEALKLSREVDPNRIRTIGVVTKIDMMGEGTDCLDILANKVYPLARGFIGVVNRSQKDINQQKEMSQAKTEEMKFFNSHPVYRSLGNRVGTEFLQKTLSEQLAVHIQNTLPKLKESIIQQLAVIKTKIDENPTLYVDIGAANASPHRIAILLVQNLVKYIDTQLGYDLERVDLEKPSAGYEISWTLLSRFCLEVEKVRPLPENLKREIYIAISNTSGIKRGAFSGGAAFIAVIKPNIRFLESPCMTVLDTVHSQLKELFNQSTQKIFNPYPELKRLVFTALQEKLFTFYSESKEFIQLLVKIQADHINTNHPDFLAAQEFATFLFRSCIGDDVYGQKKRYIISSENLIYREGPLFILNITTLRFNREYYCLLKGQTLYVYKDSSKKKLKVLFILEDCKLKDLSHRSSLQLRITPNSERYLP
ncbi:Dynamin-1 [Thelohanellus kitauei]|uniref:Dynamin-1 n=1 Tax=Thelohanellus kitauei TaxID=669202 RepID=A0A0C2MH59_THEKT|nr:Dynamin-1 [Thelohanellus kitauei]